MVKGLNVNNDSGFRINKKLVHKIVGNLSRQIGFEILFLQINFVSSEYILWLNKNYLSHDFYTDIITFNYSGENYKFDGEIFICPDTAKKNAEKYGVTLNEEILRLIVHGLLHLKGYDDRTPKEKSQMKKLENKFLEETKFLIKENIIAHDS